MPLAQTKEILRRFAKGDLRRRGQGGVALSLSGRWGVGKTYLWKQIVRQVAREDALGRSRYAYVSLFGISSIEEVRSELVVRRRPARDLDPDFDDLEQETARRAIKDWLSQHSRLLWKQRSVSALLGPGVAEALAFDVYGRNSIVCFDDLERAGPGLRIEDVLGLATQLRDERGCDILFILNEDQLGERTELYASQTEKATDHRVLYEPSSEEAFDLALPGGDPLFEREVIVRDLVRECAVTLGVTNLRVLQRVGWALGELAPVLAGRHLETVRDAVRAAVAFVWAFHSSEGAPPYARVRVAPADDLELAFLLDFQQGDEAEVDREKAAIDKQVEDLWRRYGPLGGRGAALEIARFVETGLLNREALAEKLDMEDHSEEARRGRDRLSVAWDAYHEGFRDNEAEMVDLMSDAIREEARHIKVYNAGSTIDLIRTLGYEALADELVDVYVREAEDAIRAEDESSFPPRMEIKDAPLLARIREIRSEEESPLTLDQAMADVGEGGSWGGSSSELIARTTAKELEEYLLRTHKNAHRGAVKWCLQGTRHADEARQVIARRMIQALRQIASRSDLDAYRVKAWYGVEREDGGADQAG